MTWTCRRMNACPRSLAWRGSKTPRNEFEQGGTLRASERNVLLARRDVAWRRRPPAVVGVAKSSSWSETSNPGKRHAMRRAKRRCERSERASDEWIYSVARAKARAIYPAVVEGAKDPPETGHSTMRHLCSLCAMGGVSPTSKAGTHWVKRRECTANRRSVSASNDLEGGESSATKTIRIRNTSDTNSGMRAMQSSKLKFEEQRFRCGMKFGISDGD